MATANRMRALNRLPYDFEDGLKIAGVDVTTLNQIGTSNGAGLIGFTPVGGLAASNVQAALAELDNEKVGFARLDDTDGSSLVGYDGGTVQDVLDAVTGPSGAASVGYTPAGTGTVATTVQSKLRETVSPEDFGAVGDGTEIDSTAMQLALTHAANSKRTLQLTTGKIYNCSGATLDVSCSIQGNGATIKGYLIVAGDDLMLRDFNLIATNTTWGIYLFGSTTTPTYWYRQKIENVRIAFAAGVATNDSLGINASNIINLVINNCNVQYGIQLVGCADFAITNNILDGNDYSNNNELIHASLNSNGSIIGNTFKDSLDNYIDLFTSGAKTIVSSNRFLGCKTKTGAAVELKVSLTDTSNTSSNANGWEEQIIISDNYFGNTIAYAAQFTTIISVYRIDNRASPVFSWADAPRNISILDNIFDGFDATKHGSSYLIPIYLLNVAGAIVKGNTIRNMALGSSPNDASSCVWIEKCQDVIVDSNRMTMKNGTGVFLHDNCKNITVSNNHMLQDLNANHILNFGIRISKDGSKPDPTVAMSKFIGNTVYASLAAFRQLYYANGYMNDCVISGNIFQEQVELQKINRCIVSGNKFYVGASRFQAIQVGNDNSVCEHNTIQNNQIESNSTTKKPGLVIAKVRGSNINGNTIKNATYGMWVYGSNTAGELDYLNIKDNFSISQTQTDFPYYSGINASDTALLQAANNQKIT